MKNRPQLTHLLVISLALAALAAGAWFYTSASDPVEGIPETVATPDGGAPAGQAACEEAGGVWNECASACPPDAEACILMCVQKCEGIGDDGKQVVFVHFPNSQLDPEHLDCAVTFPVKRAITDDPNLEASAALEALLQGPTEAEKAEGYFTSIPEGVELDSLTMRKATAHADFSKELSAVAGSCRVLSIRAQIEETLTQFPGVTSAVISVNGKSEDALQP